MSLRFVLPVTALTLTALSLFSLSGCGGGGGGEDTPTPTPTPTATPNSSALTRAEMVGTWTIISVKAPLLTNGSPTTYNTTGADQPCPAAIVNQDSQIPSITCGGASSLTFQEDGEVINNTGQAWLTTILSSGATDDTVGRSTWTLTPGALPGVSRITTTNQSVIGQIFLDATREASVGGKQRIRAFFGASGSGAYPQFTGVQLLMEKS